MLQCIAFRHKRKVTSVACSGLNLNFPRWQLNAPFIYKVGAFLEVLDEYGYLPALVYGFDQATRRLERWPGHRFVETPADHIAPPL